jgi:signal transduction histidine kinase
MSHLLIAPLLPFIQGESMSSLILVSIFSIPAFVMSIRWKDMKPTNEESSSPNLWVILGFVGGAFLIILAEVIQSIVLSMNPVLDNSPLGGSIVLGLNAITMGVFTYLAFTIIAKEGGRLTVDSVSVGFLSLWIIHNILKAIFLEWTAGWWLGEILLLLGLMAGPTFIGYLYLESSIQAEASSTRAKVYADVLAHDISNHHQAILYALELARLDVTPEDIRLSALNEAYLALADADRLTRNVRKLSRLEDTVMQDFQPMDLVVSIRESFNRLRKALRNPDLILNLNSQEGKFFILANDLLPDIFQNLLHNAIQYSGKNRVDVNISKLPGGRFHYCEVRVIDYGPGIPYNQRDQLFKRYMKGAKGTGLGLSVVQALTELFKGRVSIEDRVPGDFSKGSAFVLKFPAEPMQIDEE